MSLNSPLVSIVIVTYNSAEFILDMLNSAKGQTYANIELVITDDCSSDLTCVICEEWLSVNKNNFFNTQIIKTPENKGTSANINRGLNHTNGEWVKIIAGDDYLYPSCIEELMKEINTNPSIEILFSNLAVNGVPLEKKEITDFFKLNNKLQYRTLLKNSFLPVPGTFIKSTTLKKLHGFDEKYILFEDFPFLLKALKSGIKFYYVDKPLVYYRIHETNLSHEQKINKNYFKDIRRFFQLEYLKELRKNGLILHYIHYNIQYLLLIFVTNDIITNHSLYKSILSWSSPLNWKLRIKKRLFRNIEV